MILEQVEGKSGKINYERIISEIVEHIMTFCIGYKAASLKPTKKALKKVKDRELKDPAGYAQATFIQELSDVHSHRAKYRHGN